MQQDTRKSKGWLRQLLSRTLSARQRRATNPFLREAEQPPAEQPPVDDEMPVQAPSKPKPLSPSQCVEPRQFTTAGVWGACADVSHSSRLVSPPISPSRVGAIITSTSPGAMGTASRASNPHQHIRHAAPQYPRLPSSTAGSPTHASTAGPPTRLGYSGQSAGTPTQAGWTHATRLPPLSATDRFLCRWHAALQVSPSPIYEQNYNQGSAPSGPPGAPIRGIDPTVMEQREGQPVGDAQ